MIMVIKPKNWNDFQHYKDRNPPWIKLHKSLLDNYEFHSLQLASKALAPCYWLIASEHPEGLITVDTKKLAWRFRCDEKTIAETVKELISGGFFEIVRDASKALAGCKQDAMPETETETETETESLSSDDDDKAVRVPYKEIVDLYHKTLPELPRVALLNDTRKKHLKARYLTSEKTQNLEWWANYFTTIRDRKFLMEGNEKWGGADFDFLINQQKFLKIVEGGYK